MFHRVIDVLISAFFRLVGDGKKVLLGHATQLAFNLVQPLVHLAEDLCNFEAKRLVIMLRSLLGRALVGTVERPP